MPKSDQAMRATAIAFDMDGIPIFRHNRVNSTRHGELTILRVEEGDSSSRFGALLLVQDARGVKMTVRTKLAAVRLAVPIDPSHKTTDQKYGM
jgi:hypothetical protein